MVFAFSPAAGGRGVAMIGAVDFCAGKFDEPRICTCGGRGTSFGAPFRVPGEAAAGSGARPCDGGETRGPGTDNVGGAEGDCPAPPIERASGAGFRSTSLSLADGMRGGGVVFAFSPAAGGRGVAMIGAVDFCAGKFDEPRICACGGRGTSFGVPF